MDGELQAFRAPDKGTALDRIKRFTGLQPEGYVPLEVQAERSRRWTSRTLLFAVLVLGFTNAHSLQSWASTLAPNWASMTVRDMAEVWGQRMADAGFDGPRAGLRAGYEEAKTVTWKRLAGARLEVVAPKKRP